MDKRALERICHGATPQHHAVALNLVGHFFAHPQAKASRTGLGMVVCALLVTREWIKSDMVRKLLTSVRLEFDRLRPYVNRYPPGTNRRRTGPC